MLLFRFLGVAIALLCTLATTRVRADQEPILLEYSADSGCPNAREFERMVFERAHSARPALAQEPARLFTVTIHKTQQGVQGSLTVRERGVSLVRQVRGKNCRQLATVLALAAALAIDPAADLAPVRTDDYQSENTPPLSEIEPEPQDDLTTVASNQAPSREAKPQPRALEWQPAPSKVSDHAPTEDEPRAPSVLYGELGLGPRVEFGATPYPAFGPHLTLAVLSANGRWRAQLGGSWLLTPDKEVGGAAAEFRLLTGSLSLCALALQWKDHVSGGPCIHAELGDFYGRGTNIDYRTTVHRIWSTAGAHVHVRIPRGDTWFIAANIGASVLLNRYNFEFNQPDTDVFSQSAVTGTVNVLLGMVF